MISNTVSSGIYRHNWVTSLLSRMLLRSKDRQASYDLYSYLRRVDDLIDESGMNSEACLNYIEQQRALVTEMYSKGAGATDSLLGRIITNDRQNGHRFQECITLMMDVFEFDARRKRCLITARELTGYSMTLARAYTRFLVHLVAPRHRHTESDILLAHACHLAHMLRDLMVDHDLGYINIAMEDINAFALEPGDLTGEALSPWLEKEVRNINALMRQGKKALSRGRMLRVKIMGLLYCFRYEVILRRIKTEKFSLPVSYPICFNHCLRLCWQCLTMCFKHLLQCIGF